MEIILFSIVNWLLNLFRDTIADGLNQKTDRGPSKSCAKTYFTIEYQFAFPVMCAVFHTYILSGLCDEEIYTRRSVDGFWIMLDLDIIQIRNESYTYKRIQKVPSFSLYLMKGIYCYVCLYVEKYVQKISNKLFKIPGLLFYYDDLAQEDH